MAADGSVVLAVDMNISQANKKLAKLKDGIAKAEKDIAKDTAARDAAKEKSLFEASCPRRGKGKVARDKRPLAGHPQYV